MKISKYLDKMVKEPDFNGIVTLDFHAIHKMEIILNKISQIYGNENDIEN